MLCKVPSTQYGELTVHSKMTVLKRNIRRNIQFKQRKPTKQAAKVRHMWFHFIHGIEVWELVFGDIATRTFCITIAVIQLLDTSQSTENLIHQSQSIAYPVSFRTVIGTLETGRYAYFTHGSQNKLKK